jgi:hypothetical protein
MKKLPGEKWEPIKSARSANGQRYAVSNHGRMVSYMTRPEEGYLLQHAYTGGYPTISFRVQGNQKTHFVHRLVAAAFCPRKATSKRLVIHVDFKKENNHYKNLKWVTRAEQTEHDGFNPSVIRARREHSKLTSAEVKKIKTELTSGKKSVSLKALANKFGVTDMQIHRIKTGENWGHIKI